MEGETGLIAPAATSRDEGFESDACRPRAASLSFIALVVALGFLTTFAIASAYGCWTTSSGFREHDDEGFMLISTRAFNEGHALYDGIYSMYGPFPFLVKWQTIGDNVVRSARVV